MELFDEMLEDITLSTIQKILWQLLIEHGEWGLLNRLNAVEKHGFEVMIIPPEGFSDSDKIHNMTVEWLRMKGVNVWSPTNHIIALDRALHGYNGVDQEEIEY